jgi:hypothetical protein
LSCGGGELVLACFGAAGGGLTGIDIGALKPRLDPTEFAIGLPNERRRTSSLLY